MLHALVSSAVVAFYAPIPDSKKTYAITAPKEQLQAAALGLRELLMAKRLTSIEAPFPEASWKNPDGTDAESIDTQLLVTVNHVRLAGFPNGGLRGRVVTEPFAASWLEYGYEPKPSPKIDAATAAILQRVARGTSTAADAQQLSLLLNEASTDGARDERNAPHEAKP